MKTCGSCCIVTECVCPQRKWAVLLHKRELFIIFTEYYQLVVSSRWCVRIIAVVYLNHRDGA